MSLQVDCPHCGEVVVFEQIPENAGPSCPLCGGLMLPGDSAAENKRETGLAIASMVLGGLSLFSCPVIGIVAIILGIVVLSKASAEPDVQRGKGMAITGIVTGGISFVMAPLLVSVLLPSLAGPRDVAKRTVCAANIKSILYAANAYADTYGTEPPPNLQAVVAAGLLTEKCLRCPGARELNRAGDYRWVALAAGLRCSGRDVVIYEDLNNHDLEGGNVGYCDGSVQFLSADEWRQEAPSPESAPALA